MGEAVNHPAHYNAHPSGVECIDVVEHFNFNVGNAVKYLWRAGLKGDVQEDLKKAAWYIDREIQRLSKLPIVGVDPAPGPDLSVAVLLGVDADVVADGQAMMNSFYGRNIECAPKPAKKSAKDLAGEMVDRIKEARQKRGAPVPLVGANARGKTVNAGEKRWGVYCKECNIQKAKRWINDQGVCITCERGGPPKVEGADRGGCVVYRDETVKLDG